MRILIFFIALALFGCSDRTSQNKSNNSTKKTETAVNDSSWTTRLSIALNLPTINRGVDSFELRLWSSLSITDIRNVIILRFSGGRWHCTESQYWVETIDEMGVNSALSADSIQTKKVLPAIPYKDLLDSIKHYEIWNIPTQQDIPDFVDRTADGMTYTLEIAQPHKYYSVTYRNPQAYTDPANEKFNALLKFLSRSINVFTIQ